jgi:UDP-N-acetylglucosamine--N-acetylmuramyl-(pentapeptide) pyrophosphoryl-undecaprenol N-acetylglucosamine transferase
MHLLVVGGGSAGHVIPTLPVIALMQQAGAEVSYVGTHSGLEENLLSSAGVTFHAISAGKLRRYWSWQNFTDLFRIALGVVQAIALILRRRPDVVFSKGGFVSFPIAFASWLCRVPVVAHESDLTPGLANRLVLPFVATLCVSFPQTKINRARVRVVHTGTPLRDSILQGDAARGRALLGLQDGLQDPRPLLVVTGGSLGADALNHVVRRSLSQLTERFVVLHVCGPGKLADVEDPGYLQREYIDEGWGDILAAADIVLSRAGANALFELLALRKLNLLVPLSAQASRGDQLANAAYAEQQGYSAVLAESELTTGNLLDALADLTERQHEYRHALAKFTLPDAAESIRVELLRHVDKS